MLCNLQGLVFDSDIPDIITTQSVLFSVLPAVVLSTCFVPPQAGQRYYIILSAKSSFQKKRKKNHLTLNFKCFEILFLAVT